MGRFLLASIGGEDVGTLGVRLLRPGVAELRRVYVSPRARNHRIAAHMLDVALNEARSMGAREVVLETLPHLMASAVKVYESAGFHRLEPSSDLQKLIPKLSRCRWPYDVTKSP